jgi:hypothetical protein
MNIKPNSTHNYLATPKKREGLWSCLRLKNILGFVEKILI